MAPGPPGSTGGHLKRISLCRLLNKTHHQPTLGDGPRGAAPTWVVSSESHHAAAPGETISVDKVGRNTTLQQDKHGHFYVSPRLKKKPACPDSPVEMWRAAGLPEVGPDEEL